MQPNDNRDDNNLQVPGRDNQSARPDNREQAADYMRREIDRIYEIENEEVEDPSEQTPQQHSPQPVQADPDTYHQQHSEQAAHNQQAADQAAYWRHYHSAWQSYYKQYYERYYRQQLAATQQPAANQQPADQTQTTETTNQTGSSASEPQGITRDQAIGDLRKQLLGKVKKGAKKAKRSRHFAPALAAVTIAVLVLILQYNGLIIAQAKAYLSPGAIEPQSLVVGTATDVKVGPKPTITIPKISVQAPVIYDIKSLKESYIQEKLENGVVLYPLPRASSVPGQNGNTILIGHSSNGVFNEGDYKFIFVQLDELEKGDTFYLNYKGTRYTYKVVGKKVIEPDQIGKLVVGNDKPMATLITCTPPGTTWKRLVVYGKQVNPDPSKAKPATTTSKSAKDSLKLPSTPPTLLEQLFGA